MKKFLLIFLLLISSFFLGSRISNAENDICNQDPKNIPDNQLPNCIDELGRAMNLSKVATKGVQQQIAGIKARVAQIEQDIPLKEQQISDGEEKLTKLITVLDETIRKYYIESQTNCPVCQLLLNASISDFIKIQAYQQVSINQDKALITNAALLVQELQTQKEELQTEKANLAIVKMKLDKVVSDALVYQNTLSNLIAQLSARQQQILAQRLSALSIPLYASMAGGCSSDIGKDPGFSGGFAFFTYGVPNRVGLSQYGAKGRADAGQPYDTILHAYYNFDAYRTVDPNSITIKVNDSNGYNSGNIVWSGTLDQYIRRIFEVPENWPSESLKSQIIAATSYVLAETNDGNMSICANTHCQVFQNNEKGGGWGDAVSAIENEGGLKAMTKGGQTIIAWFSSTHGGYVHSSGGDIGGASWTKDAVDTTNGSASSWDDLKNNAYDGPSHADSHWFYCDWGGRGQNNTAWLQNSEVADIANVLLLAQADSSAKEHLYQVDRPNPAGTETWDANTVRQKLSAYRTPFTSISSISVSADFGSGRISSVNVSGDGGTISFNGSDFKTYFNLRAPANIQIVGPLYNIERQ